jgi:hypothetical protein
MLLRIRSVCLLTVAIVWCADPAYAQCAAAIDALDKADKQVRLAQYDVASREQPVTGKPFLVRIGKVVTMGSERTEMTSNPILVSMREAQKAGKAKCEAAGSDMYRGTAVNKIRYYNPSAPKDMNPMTLWISKATGLPVFHELAGLGPGGYAWVYGDAVTDPAGK